MINIIKPLKISNSVDVEMANINNKFVDIPLENGNNENNDNECKFTIWIPNIKNFLRRIYNFFRI